MTRRWGQGLSTYAPTTGYTESAAGRSTATAIACDRSPKNGAKQEIDLIALPDSIVATRRFKADETGLFEAVHVLHGVQGLRDAIRQERIGFHPLRSIRDPSRSRKEGEEGDERTSSSESNPTYALKS